MANGILKVGEITTSSGSGSIILGQSGETITSSATMGSGMGKILQVVSATDSTERSTTSSSYVTGSNTLSVSITPASTSNKVLLIANLGSLYFNTSNQTINTTIYRDSTNLGNTAQSAGMAVCYSEVNADIGTSQAMSVLDSPNTTSQVTD